MTPRTRLAVIALLVATAACRRSTRPPAGSRIAIGQLTSATTLDPFLQDDERSYSALDHFYDKLVTFGPEMQIVPGLALRWENVTDTEWRFHLRRGVVFHDGRPFGAEDVRATILRAQTLPGSMVGYYVQSIREVRVVDDATVVFLTRDPSPVLLNKLVFIAVVPRSAPASPIRNPIGTGPYRFVSGGPGQRLEGIRFPGFWGAAPEFERVSIVPLPDRGDRARAITSGRVDVVARFPEEFWRAAASEKSMRLVSRQGVTEVLLGFSQVPGSIFSDRSLREAVALALDRKEIAARGLKRLAAPLDQLVPSTVFGYSSRLPAAPHDLAQARSLIARSSSVARAPVTMIFPDYLRGVADEVVRQMGALGVRIDPVELPFASFNDRWARGDAPLALFGWGAGTGDASDFFDALVHSPENSFGRSNYFGYASPEMDRLIEQSDRTLDPATRLEELTKAQELLRRDLPFTPLALRFDLYALRKGLAWTPRPDRRVRAFDFHLAQPAE
jgi:peptide/nickel transport system substrate-binding protein